MEEKEKKHEGDGPLARVEGLALESLLRASIRPVDAKCVDENREELKRPVRAGVPCDAILQACGDYARYQREQAADGQQTRRAHLLTWLKQNPNRNIQYLLNAQNDQWVAGHRGAVRGALPEARQEDSARKERIPDMPRRKYTHQDPKPDRRIDRQTVVWYVEDERGGRLVQGSRGVEGREDARRLCEAMCEEETAGRR